MTVNERLIAPDDSRCAYASGRIAFDASQLALGSTGVEADATNQAAIQMDSAPSSPPDASTTQQSMWQLDLSGLRASRWFGCERLRTGAVAVISNVSYGSANSPA